MFCTLSEVVGPLFASIYSYGVCVARKYQNVDVIMMKPMGNIASVQNMYSDCKPERMLNENQQETRLLHLFLNHFTRCEHIYQEDASTLQHLGDE
jgi:hypothetical protein